MKPKPPSMFMLQWIDINGNKAWEDGDYLKSWDPKGGLSKNGLATWRATPKTALKLSRTDAKKLQLMWGVDLVRMVPVK